MRRDSHSQARKKSRAAQAIGKPQIGFFNIPERLHAPGRYLLV
jgi:hypothetical protein